MDPCCSELSLLLCHPLDVNDYWSWVSFWLCEVTAARAVALVDLNAAPAGKYYQSIKGHIEPGNGDLREN